jgi:uncharacterized protein
MLFPLTGLSRFHLAGHSDHGTHKIATHDQPVTGDVWSLYTKACRRLGNVSAMIERDDNFPPFEDLLAELEHSRMVQAEVLLRQREAAA